MLRLATAVPVAARSTRYAASAAGSAGRAGMPRAVHQRSQTRQVWAYSLRVDSAWETSSAAATRNASLRVRPRGRPVGRPVGMSASGTELAGAREVTGLFADEGVADDAAGVGASVPG
jgi:hypothetical protein